MTRPYRFLVRMAAFLAAVVAICFLLRQGLNDAFLANPPLNSMIIGVLVLGIFYNFRQVVVLFPEVTWIDNFRRDRPTLSRERAPRLLAPMATMLGERKGGRLSLSAIAPRGLLDSIGARLDESRDISRYLIGLQIFLGLLGTFWGLLETVGAVSKVISGLNTATDTASLFNDLQAGLRAPLSGMGTAFGTSLFGLAGSLVLGFLDLQASQAQNRFYIDLEEWLSSLTRLSSGGPLADSEQPVPAYIQALLEQTADNLENLQRTMARAEDSRGVNNTTMTQLVDGLSRLTEQMRAEQTLLARVAEAQMELKPVLTRLADHAERGGPGAEEAVRAHLRNVETYLARLIEDAAAGRTQMTQDLRNEIRLLARTIAALAEEER